MLDPEKLVRKAVNIEILFNSDRFLIKKIKTFPTMMYPVLIYIH